MSLLAFQDIITSVSGILMFIVLMLSLELSNEAATSAPISDPEADVARLQAAIESGHRERTRLERDLTADDQVARAAAAVAPEELRLAIRDLDQRISVLQSTVAGLESRRDSLLADKQTAESAESAATRVDSDATRKLLQQAAQLARELDEVQADDRPVFSLPRGLNKSGWLVVVSADRCEVAPLGRRASPRTIPITTAFLSGEPDISAFRDWARSQGPDPYFLLITRPSGAKAFKAIETQFESDRVSFGFDLASPRRKLIDPERGAGQ